MKVSKIILVLFILITSAASAAYAQQTFTQTVTLQNRNCNVQCTIIDAPGLNNNPAALIFVTQALGNGTSPIGALYRTYEQKWSIFNINGAVMAAGAKFNLEYYQAPDADHFVYIVPQQPHSESFAYIDHAGLNNNPDAQIRVFPTNPQTGNTLFNPYDIRVGYDASASKWLIANVSNGSLSQGLAYNVMFSSGLPTITNPNAGKTLNPSPKPPVNASGCNCVIPTSLPPNGSAGGDLSGTYPYPKVSGLQGKPLSNDPPAVGQVLKWNGSAWEPANENAGGGTTYNAGTGLAIQGTTIYANTIAPLWNANKIEGRAVSPTAPAIGQVLKWNGTAWEPAPDNTGSGAQTTPSSKSSALSFKQSGVIEMHDANVNSVPITGLNNQTFTLAQNSRVVFHTAIDIHASTVNIIDPGATGVWLSVEILNASNAVVAKSTSDAVLGTWVTHSMNSSGFGVLPAGTYHTRVLINRQAGGAFLDVTGGFGDHPSQGGQMILEIFPD